MDNLQRQQENQTGVEMMLYIPWITDSAVMECRILWEKMEEGCALNLQQVLDNILKLRTDGSWVFQTINTQNGFVNNEYSDEIISLFDCWVLMKKGDFLQWAESPTALNAPKDFVVGYDPTADFCVCSVSKELYDQILMKVTTPSFNLQYKIIETDGFKHLQHIEVTT